jgi:NAD(P)-dependent dehydrogenase (short-subunit alcohol dehydrogenase family)
MTNKGRVALVTGAAGGIGRATVAALMRDGYSVSAVDVALAALPCTFDTPLQQVSADVTDETDVARAVSGCVEHFGALDCVVHLAGAVGKGPLVDVSASDWRRLLEVNLTSAFLLAKAAHQALRARRGSLVLISSTNARNGGSALSGPAYAVAKAGIINLARYLAKEWAADGIRVNCVAPGPVDTPMLARLSESTMDTLRRSIPLGRVATPDDVAASIAFLCSPQAAYLTGTVMNVSGGLVLD